jgi:hypothetical protein
LGKLRSVFEFRKLIKIARNGLKILEFAWSRKSNLEVLLCWKLLLNLLIEILTPNALELYFG